MFESSELTDRLDEALASAQGELESAYFDAKNPHFNSDYATLTAVIKACRPILNKYGINFSQWGIHSTDNRVHLMTRVAHKGQWMRSTFSTPIGKQDPQGYVAGTTYLRRCMLGSALGISTEKDDDGNTASQTSPVPAAAVSKPPANLAPTARVARLTGLLKDFGWSLDNFKTFAAKFKGKASVSSADLTQDDCDTMEVIIKGMNYADAMASLIIGKPEEKK